MVVSKATYITLPFIPSPQGRGNIITPPLEGEGEGEGALLLSKKMISD
jgi:hypothetical protein